MKTLSPIILASVLILISCGFGFAQPTIDHIGNGEMYWSNDETSGFHSIEWSSSATGSWSRSWNSMRNLPVGIESSPIPMFYRVVWHTDPFAETSFQSPPNVTSFTGTAGDGFVGLSWTVPVSTNWAAVRIVRSTGWYAPNASSGTKVYEGAGSSHADFTVLNGVRYYYTAYSISPNDVFSAGVNQNFMPNDTTPPGPVTGFQAIAGDREVALSWNNPNEYDFAGVRIVRSTTGPPTSPNSGTIIYSGIDSQTTNAGIANNVTYYYRAYAFDFELNYSSGANTLATPFNIWPPDNVSNLVVIASNRQVTLRWTNPSGGDFLGVRIQQSTEAEPGGPFEGASVYEGSARGFTNLNLINGQPYHYKLFSYDEVPNYSSGLAVTGVPVDTIPPGNVTNVSANTGDGEVTLNWTNPGDADFSGVRIQRKVGGAPTNAFDGVTVFTGLGVSFNESGLVNGTNYFYRLFAYDEWTNYASGVSITATPVKVLLFESFEGGWVDKTMDPSYGTWSHTAPSGVWSGFYCQALSTPLVSRTGTRGIVGSDTSSQILYIPPVVNALEIRFWAYSSPSASASVSIQAFIGSSWTTVSSSQTITGNYFHREYIYKLNLLPFNGQRLRLRGGGVILDDLTVLGNPP